MKFEEVLPALREGKKVTCSVIKNSGYRYVYYEKGVLFNDENIYQPLDNYIIDNDDWEIIKEVKKSKKAFKIKIRDLNRAQFKKYCENFKKDPNFRSLGCTKCPFCHVDCHDYKDCWLQHKDLYSNKFLDQEIEIEAEWVKC